MSRYRRSKRRSTRRRTSRRRSPRRSIQSPMSLAMPRRRGGRQRVAGDRL